MTKDKQKGFTIIEVALVLAVAALIFLVVFLAVPALQRNQRDDARKRDVSNVVEGVTSYIGNGGTLAAGIYPAASLPVKAATNVSAYLEKTSNSIDNIEVKMATADATFLATQETNKDVAGAPSTRRIVVYGAAECKGNTGITYLSGATRRAAVAVQVEAGGTGKYFCQNAS